MSLVLDPPSAESAQDREQRWKEEYKTFRTWIPSLVDNIYKFVSVLSGVTLFPYQEAFSKRVIESVISGDSEELTGLWSRQSGKSEVIADTVVGLMVILPKLAPIFPDIGGGRQPDGKSKFARGFWVGTFAPVEDQANTLFSRIKSRLTDKRAVEIMADPEIDDRQVPGTEGGKYLELASGSSVRMQTANPKAKIESKTYHLIIVDEAQGAEERVVTKSIYPMGAFVNATRVLIGTCDIVKGVFYTTIRRNKIADTSRRRKNHYEYKWTVCAKYNKDYRKYVLGEREKLGEDSDEFKLSYELIWLLERGMFVPDSIRSECEDPHMHLVPEWQMTQCLAGIDVARKVDSTVVTVVWVDWDHNDEFGYYEHRILDWLEIHGDDWESQYFQVVDFLANYNLLAIAVDGQGVGDVFADRLRVLLAYRNIEVHSPGSMNSDQSERWKHLMQLLQRRNASKQPMLVWPGHSSAKRTRRWKRFDQQMRDLEKVYKGPYLLGQAPEEAEAHDDYPQSLALACSLSKDFVMPTVEVSESPFAGARRERNYR